MLIAAHPGVLGCPGSAVTGLIDCQAVVNSSGGHVLGLPLGFWGLAWLAAFWVERILALGRGSWILAAMAAIGIAYAVGTEFSVGHLCAWCTADQASIAALSIWGIAQGGRGHGGQKTAP